jgi:cytoskeletal protein CcmA (bactofilin family)
VFKKDNLETPPDKVNTVIGKGTYFSGNIAGKGLIRIDGEADGSILNKGDIIIGENGKVTAELKARNITIAGLYEGSLEAEGKLELKKTATAIGSFKANGLIIEEGAVLSGTTEMKHKEGAAAKAGVTEDTTAAKRDWSYKPLETAAKDKGLRFGGQNESPAAEKSLQ